MSTSVANRWAATCAGLAATSSEAIYADLIARYGEAHRHYHTLRHLTEVLDAVEWLGDDLADRPVTEAAAWFHDAVYDPGSSDNEAVSAALASAALTDAGVDDHRVARVGELVLATADHRAEADEPDTGVLVDADLSILGAGEGRYDEYRQAIRVEYGHLDDETYRAGRRRVLEGFLARARIFATARAQDALEDRARRNLAGELAEL